MQKVLCALGVLLISTSGWAASNEFQFISTLSSPIASFNRVETKSCAVTEPMGSEDTPSVVNAGSADSNGGTIDIKGNPIRVGQLGMEDTTSLTGDANNKWIVGQLNVANRASVGLGALIANQVVLLNSGTPNTPSDGNDTAMTVNTLLKFDNDVIAHKGAATSTLTVTSVGFVYSGEGDAAGPANGVATWHSTTQTSPESAAITNNDSDFLYRDAQYANYYLIRTN